MMRSLDAIIAKVARATPSYQDYVKKKQKENARPLSEEDWKRRVLGKPPGADKVKPKGKEDDKSKGKGRGDKAKKKDDALLKARFKELRDNLSPDLKGYPPKVEVKDLDEEHREEIKKYNLDVVGNDAAQAVEIARKIEKGISESADVCKMSPPVCVGNKGIPRDKMPQIEGGKTVQQMLDSSDELDRKKAKAMIQAGADPKDDRTILQQMIDHLKKNGIRNTKTKVAVGKLKATQKEIKAAKTFGMADAHLKGKFDNIGNSIVVSKDGFILDGHHRWAALLTIDPSRKMNVLVIDMDMDDLLKEAAATPGVYKANFQGNPLAKKEQEKYKKENRSRFSKSASLRRKKTAMRDTSYPEFIEHFPERGAAFHRYLWSQIDQTLKRMWPHTKTTLKKTSDGQTRRWVNARSHDDNITVEISIDDDGNAEISFMTHVGGPAYFQRMLAPRISEVVVEIERSFKRFQRDVRKQKKLIQPLRYKKFL